MCVVWKIKMSLMNFEAFVVAENSSANFWTIVDSCDIHQSCIVLATTLPYFDFTIVVYPPMESTNSTILCNSSSFSAICRFSLILGSSLQICVSIWRYSSLLSRHASLGRSRYHHTLQQDDLQYLYV